MLSSVEAWWAGPYARPFDGAQGDSPFLVHCSLVMSFHRLLLSTGEDFKYSYISLIVFAASSA
ncbi:MAG: hypothetical protein JWR38_5334 [Mucilaginibacter sp.]|nr:hypothetical protein [Mucilaginibacter sp.]